MQHRETSPSPLQPRSNLRLDNKSIHNDNIKDKLQTAIILIIMAYVHILICFPHEIATLGSPVKEAAKSLAFLLLMLGVLFVILAFIRKKVRCLKMLGSLMIIIAVAVLGIILCVDMHGVCKDVREKVIDDYRGYKSYYENEDIDDDDIPHKICPIVLNKKIWLTFASLILGGVGSMMFCCCTQSDSDVWIDNHSSPIEDNVNLNPDSSRPMLQMQHIDPNTNVSYKSPQDNGKEQV